MNFIELQRKTGLTYQKLLAISAEVNSFVTPQAIVVGDFLECNINNIFQSQIFSCYLQVSQLLQPSHAIFCDKLDIFLKGGITHGHLTEFSGAPGLGKTQLCLQLALSNTLHGGINNGVLYIDTEGAFSSSRYEWNIKKKNRSSS